MGGINATMSTAQYLITDFQNQKKNLDSKFSKPSVKNSKYDCHH